MQNRKVAPLLAEFHAWKAKPTPIGTALTQIQDGRNLRPIYRVNWA